MEVKKYEDKDSIVWDEFLDRCRNSLFLFKRHYMKYHNDRFVDHSLMFFEGNRLLAVLPASIKKNQLYSHKDAFVSNTGWPAFSDTIDKKRLSKSKHISYNKSTKELKCRNCGLHLGHRFIQKQKIHDCINSTYTFY